MSRWGERWGARWGGRWGSIGATVQCFHGLSYVGGMSRHKGVSRPSATASTHGLMGVSGNLHVDSLDATSCLINGELP